MGDSGETSLASGTPLSAPKTPRTGRAVRHWGYRRKRNLTRQVCSYDLWGVGQVVCLFRWYPRVNIKCQRWRIFGRWPGPE